MNILRTSADDALSESAFMLGASLGALAVTLVASAAWTRFQIARDKAAEKRLAAMQ